MNELSGETLRQLAPDILFWLESASPEDIYDYFTRLPESQMSLVEKITPLLLNSFQVKRNESLATYFGTDLLVTLSELDLVMFTSYLAAYNPQSVCSRFIEKYPTLRLELNPNIISSDLSDTCLTLTETFLSIQYFATVPRYSQIRVYATSLINQKLSSEQYVELDKIFGELITKLGQALENNNYEDTLLTTDVTIAIRESLGKLHFLPKTLIDSLSKDLLTHDNFDILSNISYVTTFVSTSFGTVSGEDTLKQLNAALRETIRNEWYQEYVQSHNLPAISRPDAEKAEFVKWVMKTVTRNFIMNKAEWPSLTTHISNMSPIEQKIFRAKLLIIFRQMPLFIMVFETVDFDFFFNNILQSTGRLERNEFIQGLEKRVDPELWPLSQSGFMFLATIF